MVALGGPMLAHCLPRAHRLALPIETAVIETTEDAGLIDGSPRRRRLQQLLRHRLCRRLQRGLVGRRLRDAWARV